ncbi:NAD(P)/FAD-dependent oxidoreductase [Burkholderia thailandensis]|uniref:NAD(P)/FAD-dependent oxidoreductase n=1 Tax=Burkholderia thailandensis TaxID=57975 RepID=UPI00384FF9E7
MPLSRDAGRRRGAAREPRAADIARRADPLSAARRARRDVPVACRRRSRGRLPRRARRRLVRRLRARAGVAQEGARARRAIRERRSDGRTRRRAARHATADGRRPHVRLRRARQRGGPWARSVAAFVGVDLPVRARRRSIFNVSSPAALPRCPLVIDPSGVYFRPEGASFICGAAPPPERDFDDLPLDDIDHALFDDLIWPTLAHRVPQFEALRVTRSWSGYYEYNVLDQNAIIGPHPDVDNCIFANGFSGHGLQQGPATGRGVAELIVHGRYTSLDLSPLGFARVLEGRPIIERNVV